MSALYLGVTTYSDHTPIIAKQTEGKYIFFPFHLKTTKQCSFLYFESREVSKKSQKWKRKILYHLL